MSEEMRKKIVAFAESKVGTKVGSGQCFDLADEALRDAGAKSAEHYGDVDSTADYVWGEKVMTEKALAGDVIQFRDYTGSVTHYRDITIDFGGGDQISYYESLPDEKDISYKHHTSIAKTAISRGSLTVLEQNVDRTGNGVNEQIVRGREIYLTSRPKTETKSKQRVTINSAWADIVKKDMTDPKHKKFVDDLLKKYRNKSFEASVTTTFQVSVSGKIWVYRAQ